MIWQFATTCVNSTAALINALIDSERQISYRTFRRALGGAELDRWASEMLYDVGSERGGLRLKDDFCVSFYRGRFDGRRALFVRHSAIEHIWTLERD